MICQSKEATGQHFVYCSYQANASCQSIDKGYVYFWENYAMTRVSHIQYKFSMHSLIIRVVNFNMKSQYLATKHFVIRNSAITGHCLGIHLLCDALAINKAERTDRAAMLANWRDSPNATYSIRNQIRSTVNER